MNSHKIVVTALISIFIVGLAVQNTVCIQHCIDDEIDESEMCLNSIFDITPRNKEHSVGAYIDLIKNEEKSIVYSSWNDELSILGIKYIREEGLLFISNSNINLKKSLESTQYQDYRRLLKRHYGYVNDGRRWLNGKNTRGILIRV